MKQRGVIEASQLPEGAKVYLKKDWTGWRVVEPIFGEDDKLKWKRIIFGTTKERLFLAFILLIALLGYLAFQEQINNSYEILSNPCAYCVSCQDHTRQILIATEGKKRFEPFKLNFSVGETNE